MKIQLLSKLDHVIIQSFSFYHYYKSVSNSIDNLEKIPWKHERINGFQICLQELKRFWLDLFSVLASLVKVLTEWLDTKLTRFLFVFVRKIKYFRVNISLFDNVYVF